LQEVIKVHDAPVHSVATVINSPQVATASWDATVKIYDLSSRQVVRTLPSTQVETPEEGKMGGLYAVAYTDVIQLGLIVFGL